MKPLLFVLLVLLIGCSENPVEPTQQTIQGQWKYEYVSYQYQDVKDVVSGIVEFSTLTDHITGTMTYKGETLTLGGFPLDDRFIVMASKHASRISLDLTSDESVQTLTGTIEFTNWTGAYWYSVGVYQVRLVKIR